MRWDELVDTVREYDGSNVECYQVNIGSPDVNRFAWLSCFLHRWISPCGYRAEAHAGLDPRTIYALRVAWCQGSAHVLCSIAKELGFRACRVERFSATRSHATAEILIGDEWIEFDPHFGLIHFGCYDRLADEFFEGAMYDAWTDVRRVEV